MQYQNDKPLLGRWIGLLGPSLLLGLVALHLPATGYAQTLSQVMPDNVFWGYLSVSANPTLNSISPEQASQEEQQLQADPENQDARFRLLMYYWNHHMNQQRVESVSWLIAHHPDSRMLGLDVASVMPQKATSNGVPQNDAADLERVRNLWESMVYQQMGTAAPVALHNAARFFEMVEPEKTVELAKRLQQQDPADYTKTVASLYSHFLLGNLGPPASERRDSVRTIVMQSLMQSSDAAFVGTVARQLVSNGTDSSCQTALQLVTRAQQLEPQNQQWSDLMEGAKALRCGGGTTIISSTPAVRVSPVPSQIRVGGMVQAANLLQSELPEYPALAKQAHVQGTVSFNIVVGKDGHITKITLVSGHPLLVQSAMQALQQYVYKPTLLNGQPVEVITTVDIPFHLDAE